MSLWNKFQTGDQKRSSTKMSFWNKFQTGAWQRRGFSPAADARHTFVAVDYTNGLFGGPNMFVSRGFF